MPGLDLPGAGLDGTVDRLAHEFAGTFARETVAECVADSHARLGHARIAQYQPPLAYRFARERVRASAKAAGLLPPSGLPEVLFVCTRNAGRSQLAAALLAHRSQGQLVVRSAGTEAAPEVDADVLAALAEIRLDAGEAFAKPLTDETVAAADVVVTMGRGDACPVLPGRRYLDWDIADPAGHGLDAAREARDRIDGLVRDLLVGLDAA